MVQEVKKYTERKLKQMAVDFDWKGTGLEGDPLIIESSRAFPEGYQIKLRNSNLFIHFKECNLDILDLRKCRNLTIENSRFIHLVLHKCFDIIIKNSICEKTFEPYGCEHMVIEGCNTKYFEFSYCYFNTIKNCSISSMNNIFSRANTFENNAIPEEVHKEITEGNEYTKSFNQIVAKYTKIYLPLLFVFLISLFLWNPFSKPSNTLIPFGDIIEMVFFIYLIGLIIFISLTVFIFGIKRGKQEKKIKERYPPNEIK
ncbi:MAG: hypothetical protein ACFFAN_12890 [Promethearchaeota archaeon]